MVGIVMLTACGFTIALILFLKPSVGDEKKTYEVRFSNINGIGIGTRVMFAGRPVGEVTAIREIPQARKERSDSLGRLYVYELTLKVDSSVTLYNSDSVTIQTSGLLGEKSIAIVPLLPPPGMIVRPVKAEPVYAESADLLETAAYQLSHLATGMERTFTYFGDWMAKNGDNLGKSVQAFGNTMEEAEKVLKEVNDSRIVEEIGRGISRFSSVMQDAHDSLQELQKGGFFPHLNTIAANLDTTTSSIASGKGTIGKLIEQDDLYLQVVSLLTKADTLMNDVNHYGLLFHLNKTWQRQRLQPMTALEALNSPASFKSYFENEVQEVNLALSRLSILLDKAEHSPQGEVVFQTPKFSRDFADFLREVQTLAETVRLYNDRLVKMKKECNPRYLPEKS